jgi:hypothetical protein
MGMRLVWHYLGCAPELRRGGEWGGEEKDIFILLRVKIKSGEIRLAGRLFYSFVAKFVHLQFREYNLLFIPFISLSFSFLLLLTWEHSLGTCEIECSIIYFFKCWWGGCT